MDWEERLDEWELELELSARLEGSDWVTLEQAAADTGASRAALRSWYRTGQIPSRLVDGPHRPPRRVPAMGAEAGAGVPAVGWRPVAKDGRSCWGWHRGGWMWRFGGWRGGFRGGGGCGRGWGFGAGVAVLEWLCCCGSREFLVVEMAGWAGRELAGEGGRQVFQMKGNPGIQADGAPDRDARG